MDAEEKQGPGRPTKYKDEYATEEFLVRFKQWCKDNGTLISLCGLACYCEVCEDTIQEWQKVHSEFSVSLEKIKQLSKQMLINKGLDSTYNSTIAKLVLSSNHGMAEKTKREHSLDETTATLLGLIDGGTKGKLPTGQEVEDSG